MTQGEIDPEGGQVRQAPRASFRVNVAQTTVTNLAVAGINVGTGLIVARLLGPEGRGELAAILSWPMLIAALATLGLPDAIVYFCARLPRRAGAHFATALTVSLAASVVFTGIGWVIMPWVLAAQDAEVVTAARWYLVSVPLAATLGLADRPLRGIGDFRGWNLMRTAPTLAWLGVVVVGLARGGSTAASLAIAFLLVRVALVVPILRFVHGRVEGRWRPDRALVGPMLRYGIPSFITVLPTILNQRLDQIIMAAFLPAGTLGLYVVAVAWSSMLAPVLLAFANVLFPRIAAEHQTEEQRGDVFARGLRVGVLLAFTMGLGAALITPIGLPLVFGGDFRDAVPAALILVAAAVLTGINQVGEEGLRGLGRPMLVLRAEACGLVVTLIGLSLLIRRYELIGAAIASFAGYGTVTLFVILGGRSHTGLALRRLLVPGGAEVRSVVNALRPTRRGAPK